MVEEGYHPVLNAKELTFILEALQGGTENDLLLSQRASQVGCSRKSGSACSTSREIAVQVAVQVNYCFDLYDTTGTWDKMCNYAIVWVGLIY